MSPKSVSDLRKSAFDLVQTDSPFSYSMLSGRGIMRADTAATPSIVQSIAWPRCLQGAVAERLKAPDLDSGNVEVAPSMFVGSNPTGPAIYARISLKYSLCQH